jgi:hypothetical protein
LVVLELKGAEQSGRKYLYEALDYVAKGKVRVMTETFPKFSFLDLPCALSLFFEFFSAESLWARLPIALSLDSFRWELGPCFPTKNNSRTM